MKILVEPVHCSTRRPRRFKVYASQNRVSSVRITAATKINAMFSPNNFTELLSQLPELQGYNPEFIQLPDGSFQMAIGNNVYDVVWV